MFADLLLSLLGCGVVGAVVALTITSSSLTSELRVLLVYWANLPTGRIRMFMKKKLVKLLNCPICMSYWINAALVYNYFNLLRFMYSTSVVIDAFVSWMLVVGVSYIFLRALGITKSGNFTEEEVSEALKLMGK